ncbi:MAG: VOC family protein [Bacteroidota bacterium]
MTTQIFINLAVRDLNKSIAFFTKLGYSFNPQFTDENATCMIVSDNIFVMLLVEPFFKTFTTKEICDTSKALEVLNCFSAESREKVDEIVDTAIAAGAVGQDTKDHGWMYIRSFSDLDGHHWEYAYMDLNALPKE